MMSNFRLRKRLKPILPNARLRRTFLGSSRAQERIEERLTLGMPATYRIRVQGFLVKRWADRLGGMSIETRDQKSRAPLTTLVGRVRDQAELMGVLNSLYELQIPLLSVELLTVK
jgi:hypothetical protein